MIIPVWIFGVGLVTVGIFLLVNGVRQILKAVGGSVLLRLPLTQKNGRFNITNAGDYAIWQSGRTLQRVPVKMPTPVISSQLTAEKIRVSPVFSGVRVNNGWEGRIQLFTFRADVGPYELDLPVDASAYHTESPYFVEIREQRPGYLLVTGILTLIFAAACLIAGLVLPVVLK